MSDKTINLLLTFAAIGLVIYGIYNMTMKKDNKEETKTSKEVKFNYKKELDLVDNFILNEDFKFDNELKLQIACSNIQNKDLKKTSSTFNNIKYYEFGGYYIKESKFKELLNDLFGKDNYILKSFTYNDSYYLYDKDDKCFYVFYSTLVTNCANSGDYVTNCIEVKPYCETKYTQDSNNIIVNVGCINERNDIKVEYNDYQTKYSYKYIYDYDKSLNDYYISDIELIKE